MLSERLGMQDDVDACQDCKCLSLSLGLRTIPSVSMVINVLKIACGCTRSNDFTSCRSHINRETLKALI